MRKRGQWDWHHTKMLDPARAERLWLVLAVSTLWVVGVGSQASGTVAANACGTPDGRQRDEGATRTRTELSHARTAVRARVSLARGGMATGGLMAGGVARALSCRSPVACGQAAEATQTA
jgi:hypothetical protein